MKKIILFCALLVAGCWGLGGDAERVSVNAGHYGNTNASEEASEHCFQYGKHAILIYSVGDTNQFACQ